MTKEELQKEVERLERLLTARNEGFHKIQAQLVSLREECKVYVIHNYERPMRVIAGSKSAILKFIIGNVDEIDSIDELSIEYIFEEK